MGLLSGVSLPSCAVLVELLESVVESYSGSCENTESRQVVETP